VLFRGVIPDLADFEGSQFWREIRSAFSREWGASNIRRMASKSSEILHHNVFYRVNFSAQLFVRREHFAKPNKGSHDRDVYLHGARAVKHAGKLAMPCSVKAYGA